VGRTKYRVPQDTAKVTPVFAGAMDVVAGRDLMQPKTMAAHHDGQK
jgi:hypothetical protein